jgi:2-amino-4-hydroxy-6-hydroxymethyldihydropteridine diphosphokinase
MNRAFISLGSNIDKERNLPAAVRLLAERCRLVAVSTVYETLPAGLPEQANYLNAAVLVETELGPAELKEQILTRVEQDLDRVRTADRHAPRTIDVDLALFNDAVLEYDGHQIPDPDLLKYPHAAVPIADIAPDLPHPETGEPMHVIASRLLQEGTARNEGEAPLWPRPDIDLRH